MNRSSSLILRAAIVVFGIAVVVFLAGEPHLEGRNAHATLFEIYFNDTFLAIAYAASIPFFVALYQAFKLFGDAACAGRFSLHSLSALRIIRVCALLIIGFALAEGVYLFAVVGGTDNIAGGVAMSVFVAACCVATVTATILFETALRTRTMH